MDKLTRIGRLLVVVNEAVADEDGWVTLSGNQLVRLGVATDKPAAVRIRSLAKQRGWIETAPPLPQEETIFKSPPTLRVRLTEKGRQAVAYTKGD